MFAEVGPGPTAHYKNKLCVPETILHHLQKGPEFRHKKTTLQDVQNELKLIQQYETETDGKGFTAEDVFK
eukprot:888466-Prymnesium_polylepis.1